MVSIDSQELMELSIAIVVVIHSAIKVVFIKLFSYNTVNIWRSVNGLKPHEGVDEMKTLRIPAIDQLYVYLFIFTFSFFGGKTQNLQPCCMVGKP